MQPADKKSDAELCQWAASLIAQAQQAGTFGTVTVHLDAGRIVRVRIERNELPPVTKPASG